MSYFDDLLKWAQNAKGLTGQPIYRPESGQIDFGINEKVG